MDQSYAIEVAEAGKLATVNIPLRRAMNALLLDSYVADCKRIVDRWNRTIARYVPGVEIRLPHQRFNRNVGIHAGRFYDPSGAPITAEAFAAGKAEWFPSQADYDYVKSCMKKVWEPGKIANWIAPPAQGINNNAFEYQYVKFH